MESSTSPFDPEGLARDLAGPRPLELPWRADRLRRALHGRRTWYGVIAHVAVGPRASRCPVCGAHRRDGAPWVDSPWEPSAFSAAATATLTAAVTELHVIPPAPPLPPGSLPAVARAMQSVIAASSTSSVPPTFQLGSASDLIAEIDGGAAPAASARPGDPAAERALLQELHAEGLRVVSDGTRPVCHPTRGATEGRRWERFWRTAASVGLKGHASVLHGSRTRDGELVEQLARIADLQRTTQVFASVAPVAAPGDPGLTDGLTDLKVLAACRLALTSIPHVRVAVNAGDWKMAQVALACGADDLEGHVSLAARDRRADFEADDLTLPELQRWLEEEGFTPVRRNGLYEEP